MANQDLELISRIFQTKPTIRAAIKNQFLTSAAVSRTDSQHAANRAAKDLARNIAIKSWEEDPEETIKDLAVYIRDCLVDCDHRKYEWTTVKNWIKDLAPEERRKPGRPSNRV